MPEMMVKTKCKLYRVLKKRLVPIALLEFESQLQENQQTPKSWIERYVLQHRYLKFKQ